MSAPTTCDELLDLGQKSGILDRKGLDDYLGRMRDGSGVPPAPRELAEAMVRDGLLTRFQAEQLLQGRWRNFLLAGKYRLLERLGEGGMAAVFLCEHLRLRRRVAIKVLPSAQAKDASLLERFCREGRAVAALDHPNIVKVHDIDDDGKTHFLVMEYVEGATLHDLVKRKGPMDPERAAHYVAQAALGLQHAHDAGLVHRDIKPGNLLLDRGGTVKILDLGLARFFNDDGDCLTRDYDAYAVLGTADYLAPEQAVNSSGVDGRADVYSLGMTLYYLLAGAPPFAEGTINQKLIWHQMRDPEAIRRRRPEVPAGMAAVLDRMIAKKPEDRHQRPDEVAEALAPWTEAPIPAPPEDEMPRLSPAALGGPGTNGPSASTPPPTRRSVPAPATPPPKRRNQALQAGTPVAPSSERVSTDPKVKAPAVATTQVLKNLSVRGARWLRAPAHRNLALLALILVVGTAAIVWVAFVHKPAVVVEKVDDAPGRRGAGPPAHAGARGQPAPKLNRNVVGLIATLRGHTRNVERVAVSPDGRLALSCSHDQTLRLWDLETGEQLRVFSGHRDTVHDVCFSPDGRLALSAGYDNTARLWRVADGRQVGSFGGRHATAVRAVAFSPDGRRVLTGAGDTGPGGRDCTVRLWDVATGQEIRRFEGHTAAVWAVAFSPDGRRVLSGSYDKTARVWDAASGQEITIFTGHGATVHSAAFSPDGSHAVTVGGDKTARIWDASNGEELLALKGHTATVAAVAFAPDGRHLLTGADDKTLRLWDIQAGKEVTCFRGHEKPVWGVAFTPDGRLAVSAGADHTVRLWGLPAFVAEVPVGANPPPHRPQGRR